MGSFVGLSALTFATAAMSSSTPDTSIEDSQQVDMAGNGVQSTLDVVSDAVNNTVAVYLSDFAFDGGDILARRYPLDGSPSDEKTLQTLCGDCGRREAVAVGRADGQFALLWTGDASSTDTTLYGQRYDTQLNTVGSRLVIDSQGGRSVRADMNSSGEFAMFWSTIRNSASVWAAQRFDASGNPAGTEQQINATANGGDIAISESGDFAVTYFVEGADSTNSIILRRFAADGSEIGAQQTVGTLSFPSREALRVEIAGNETILVAWEPSAIDDTVVGRLYSANGVPQGDQFTISTALQTSWAVASSVGGFVLVVEGDDDVFVRRLATDGSLTDPVVAYSGDDPDLVRISSDADWDYATLVTEDGFDDNGSVFLRRFVGGENVDIAATITTAADTVDPGSVVAFDVLVDNNHDSVAPLPSALAAADIVNRAIGSATGLSVTATLPTDMSSVAVADTAAPTGRSLDCGPPANGKITCTLNGVLYAGESVSARITATAPDDNKSSLQASVQASADQFDSNESNGNNTDRVAFAVGQANSGSDSGTGGSDDDSDGGGGGCTMTDAKVPFDPLFAVLCMAAVLVLMRRRWRAGSR
ncbi:VBCS repeat-containing protein [Salinisphaera sp. S4-8]|uniref:JDVT-CTERM domain-containing protein n=1 Tax=Salinisphaera sp. S4-8 TaxID=633357 RepID=UPI00333F7D87